jgi:ankyrin repeat protein
LTGASSRSWTRGAVDRWLLAVGLILGIMAVSAANLILAGLDEIGQARERPSTDAPAQEARSEPGGDWALELARTGRWPELQQGIVAGLPPDPPGTEPHARTALMYATVAGRFGVAQVLLEAGAQPDRRDESGNTALILATDHHHFDIARALLDAGADASAISAQGGGTLNGPARQGDNALIERLLEGGADPDASMREGWRPLHYAAGGGHNGAIHAADNAGLDALMYAAGQGHLPTVSWLLERGADRTRRARDGRAAEDMAAAGGFADVVLTLQTP